MHLYINLGHDKNGPIEQCKTIGIIFVYIYKTTILRNNEKKIVDVKRVLVSNLRIKY